MPRGAPNPSLLAAAFARHGATAASTSSSSDDVAETEATAEARALAAHLGLVETEALNRWFTRPTPAQSLYSRYRIWRAEFWERIMPWGMLYLSACAQVSFDMTWDQAEPIIFREAAGCLTRTHNPDSRLGSYGLLMKRCIETGVLSALTMDDIRALKFYLELILTGPPPFGSGRAVDGEIEGGLALDVHLAGTEFGGEGYTLFLCRGPDGGPVPSTHSKFVANRCCTLVAFTTNVRRLDVDGKVYQIVPVDKNGEEIAESEVDQEQQLRLPNVSGVQLPAFVEALQPCSAVTVHAGNEKNKQKWNAGCENFFDEQDSAAHFVANAAAFAALLASSARTPLAPTVFLVRFRCCDGHAFMTGDGFAFRDGDKFERRVLLRRIVRIHALELGTRPVLRVERRRNRSEIVFTAQYEFLGADALGPARIFHAALTTAFAAAAPARSSSRLAVSNMAPDTQLAVRAHAEAAAAVRERVAADFLADYRSKAPHAPLAIAQAFSSPPPRTRAPSGMFAFASKNLCAFLPAAYFFFLHACFHQHASPCLTVSFIFAHFSLFFVSRHAHRSVLVASRPRTRISVVHLVRCFERVAIGALAPANAAAAAPAPVCLVVVVVVVVRSRLTRRAVCRAASSACAAQGPVVDRVRAAELVRGEARRRRRRRRRRFRRRVLDGCRRTARALVAADYAAAVAAPTVDCVARTVAAAAALRIWRFVALVVGVLGQRRPARGRRLDRSWRCVVFSGQIIFHFHGCRVVPVARRFVYFCIDRCLQLYWLLVRPLLLFLFFFCE